MISEKAVEAGILALAKRRDASPSSSFIEHMRPVFEKDVRAVLEAALSLHDAPVECKQEAVAPLREALRALVEAKALAGVRKLVAGWNGEGRKDGPYKRHDYELGATLPKTCCGEVYELDDAMQAARALIAEERKP